MRITRYDIEQEENGRVHLICEHQSNYSGISRITSPDEVYKLMEAQFNLSKKIEERMYLLALKTNGGLSGLFEVSHGAMDVTVANPREIFRRLLLVNASKFILVHNHPSGDPTPSREDIAFTETIKKLSDMMVMKMDDHVITGNGCYYSMMEHGVF